MNIDSALAGLIGRLAARIGLPGLTLDAQGACAIHIDDRFVVGLQCRDDDELVMYADLGVPVQGPNVYPGLLRGNLFWRATLGATLSLTWDDPPHVVLALPLSWRIHDEDSLARQLETFMNAAEDWADAVEGRSTAANTAAEPEPGMELLLKSRA